MPFEIEVAWDRAPSLAKYGHVNSLLFALTVLLDHNTRLTDPDGKLLTKLIFAPLRRKITDQNKRWFSIIGLPYVSPLLIGEYDGITLEVYFNYHFFYETETTFRQYFPGASLCIRCRNFLMGSFVPSPGSWGSDITSLTWDWDGTFIIEAGPNGVTSAARKNFRGFKYIPSPFKIFLCDKVLPKREERYITNNGFNVLVSTNEMPDTDSALGRRLLEFLCTQQKRKSD